MSKETTIGGYFLVCVDCLVAHEYGQTDPERDKNEPAPWALWDDPSDVANANVDEHGEDQCQDFSWHACEGCGSTLGGSRHRYAWFAND